MIITKWESRWDADPVKTEVQTYTHLKPKDSDAWTYYAIPWSSILNQNMEGNEELLLLPRARGKAFTTCQHYQYKRIIPIMCRLGIGHLFTPHATCESVGCVAIHPHFHYPAVIPVPGEKDLLFSFIGMDNHPVRREINKFAGGLVALRERWHFKRPSGIQDAEDEYSAALSRSTFSLCPRGVGSSSLRITESLIAGAIPVIIADDLRMPPGLGGCCLHLRERHVDVIPAMLQSIPNSVVGILAGRCLKLASSLIDDFSIPMNKFLL